MLTYTLPPAAAVMTVCGPVRVTLYAESSARDTDWVARLSVCTGTATPSG